MAYCQAVLVGSTASHMQACNELLGFDEETQNSFNKYIALFCS